MGLDFAGDFDLARPNFPLLAFDGIKRADLAAAFPQAFDGEHTGSYRGGDFVVFAGRAVGTLVAHEQGEGVFESGRFVGATVTDFFQGATLVGSQFDAIFFSRHLSHCINPQKRASLKCKSINLF
jgi:hypothetical protein